jgi:hypothetical protein
MIYPIALEAVQRLDALFEIERGISGKATAERLTVRQELGAPLMTDLHAWLTAQLAKLSRSHDLAKAINYVLRSWDAFTRFLGDGRTCITNNAAEAALRSGARHGWHRARGRASRRRAGTWAISLNPQSGELPCRRQTRLHPPLAHGMMVRLSNRVERPAHAPSSFHVLPDFLMVE